MAETLSYILLLPFFGPDRAQRSVPIILNLLINRNIALIFSVSICEPRKQKNVHGQGASNITYSTIVFNFDVCRLRFPNQSPLLPKPTCYTAPVLNFQ